MVSNCGKLITCLYDVERCQSWFYFSILETILELTNTLLKKKNQHSHGKRMIANLCIFGNSYCESTNTTTTKASMVHSRCQKTRGVAENSANTEGGKIQSRRKGESHRDAFRPCSRVSSGGRTSRETNRKSRREEKD